MRNEHIHIRTSIRPCQPVHLGCNIQDAKKVNLNATIKEGQIGQEVKRDIAELKEDVAEINQEIEVINNELETKVEDVIGNPLIETTKEGNTVFLTSKTFIFEQAVASDTWVIKHDLNKRPHVTIVDSAGSVFDPAVSYDDDNTCTVEMLGATTGYAYLN